MLLHIASDCQTTCGNVWQFAARHNKQIHIYQFSSQNQNQKFIFKNDLDNLHALAEKFSSYLFPWYQSPLHPDPYKKDDLQDQTY